MEQEDEIDQMFLTFSVEEIKWIMRCIMRPTPTKIAVEMMPRYTQQKHAAYEKFYRQQRETTLWYSGSRNLHNETTRVR